MEQFSALLVSNDPGALGITQRVLEEYGFVIKIAATAKAAEEAIKSAKFDLAVYDNDVAGAIQLAGAGASIIAPKMIFGMMRNGTVAEVHGKRVHFIMQKPFTGELFARSLRAAFGVILKERRVAFRHPVQIVPALCVATRDQGTKDLTNTMILDISQTGMCLQTTEMLSQGTVVKVRFPLPDTKVAVLVSGVVMWTRASGRTGIKFADVEAEQQKILNEWLRTQASYIPEPVLRSAAGYHAART